MKQPILVTGGAGYIGSHTARALVETGRGVVVVDNLGAGKELAVPKGAVFEHADTRDLEAMRRIMKQYHPSAVMHFAAFLAVGDSVEDPLRFYDNNVSGAIHLLQAMVENGVKQFIFSSTCAIYGQPNHVPIDESFPPRPESPYGQTKLAVEQMLPWVERAHGMQWISLRYFNAAGAHADGTMGLDTPHPTQLIPRAILALLHGEAAEVNGTDWPTFDGTCIRDYIHVSDLASAHIRALERLEKGGASTMYNLGTGQGSSIKQVLQAIELASGKKLTVVNKPRRPGDPAEVFADSAKAQKELSWSPKYTDINDIVKTAWQWHSTHPKGYSEND